MTEILGHEAVCHPRYTCTRTVTHSLGAKQMENPVKYTQRGEAVLAVLIALPLVLGAVNAVGHLVAPVVLPLLGIAP
jgi:hypothetical protein